MSTLHKINELSDQITRNMAAVFFDRPTIKSAGEHLNHEKIRENHSIFLEIAELIENMTPQEQDEYYSTHGVFVESLKQYIKVRRVAHPAAV